MNKGVSNIGRTNKAELFGGIPVIGANNGLTVVGGLVQLGGANPLIQNTFIDQAGFQYQHLNGAQDLFNIDPATGLCSLGDILGIVNGTHIVLNDAAQVAGIFTSPFGGPAALLIQNGLSTCEMGDVGNVVNQTFLRVDDSIQAIQLIGGAANQLKFDAASPKLDLTLQGFLYLNIDPSNNLYQAGDMNLSNNGGFIELNDAIGNFFVTVNGGKRIDLDAVSGIDRLGDVSSLGNNTQVMVFDVNSQIQFLATLGVGINMVPTLSPFAIAALQNFANNAAAVGGGLGVGDLYRISIAGTSAVAVVE